MQNNNIKAIAVNCFWKLIKQVLNNNPGIMDNKKVAYYLNEIVANKEVLYFIAETILKEYVGCGCDEGTKCDLLMVQANKVLDELKLLINELKGGN